LKKLATAAGLVALAGSAQAALVSLGDGTVKDTNTNLTFAGSSDWELPEISEYAALFSAYGKLTTVTAFTNVQSGHCWSDTAYALSATAVARRRQSR
jgi:hypothetical protein